MNISLAATVLVIWLIGIGLHLMGVSVLKQLREDAVPQTQPLLDPPV
jgi:hypothetical protein